jgi:hypothetical protein
MGLISRWIGTKLTKSALAETDEWIEKLKYLDTSEIATIVLVANHQRIQLSQMWGIDLSVPHMALVQRPNLRIELHQLIVSLQHQNQAFMASGVMVWLHTTRAASDPTFRRSGRELWRQLERGFPYVHEAALSLTRIGLPLLDTSGASTIPYGMTPDPYRP